MVESNDRTYQLGLNASSNDLRRVNEIEGFETHYFMLAPYLGAEQPMADFLGKGSLRLEAGYSHVSGDQGNMGSSRHRGELRLGWIHRFPIDPINLFVLPQAGIGLGGDKLNFGGGLDPEWAFGAGGMLQGTAGVEFCPFDHYCFSAQTGYFFERNIVGEPYINRGVLFGLAVSSNPQSPKPEVRIVTRVEERIVYRDKIIIHDKPATLTVEEIFRAMVSDGDSFGLPYFFKHESTELGLRQGEEPNLTILVLSLQQYPNVRLMLIGHTDDLGPPNYNNWLSYQRALEVQKYLVGAGIPRERIIVDGEDLSIRKCNKSDGAYFYYTHPDTLDYSADLLPERAKTVRVGHLDENTLCSDDGEWIRNARGTSVLGSSKTLVNIADPKMRRALEKRVEFVKLK